MVQFRCHPVCVGRLTGRRDHVVLDEPNGPDQLAAGLNGAAREPLPIAWII
jgi:hypothetical protein